MKGPLRILSAALLLMLMLAGAQPLNVTLFDGGGGSGGCKPPCQGFPCPQ